MHDSIDKETAKIIIRYLEFISRIEILSKAALILPKQKPQKGNLKMPKKFAGENSKAAAARARKTAAKEEDDRRREKEKEDEYWKDEDKLIQKKLQRKEQQEKKRLEQLQKKAELKDLLEKEDSTLKAQSKRPPAKITKAQILEEQEKRNAAAMAKKKEPVTHINKPLEENINRLQVDGLEARSITEAISILSTKDEEDDRHPEKRMKAAYAAFEAANLPRIKAENPSLRLSQWKQILNKDWMRAPENPMNQRRT